MGKKTRITLAVLLVIVLGFIGWLCLAPGKPDPVYNGKRLSAWVNGLTDAKRRGEFLVAFRRMDDQTALVILTEALDKKETSAQRRYLWLWQKPPAVVSKHLPSPVRASTIHFWASLYIGMRMQYYKPAVPKLLALIESKEDVPTRLNAMNTLRRMLQLPHPNDDAEMVAVRSSLQRVAEDKTSSMNLQASVALMTANPFGVPGNSNVMPPRLIPPFVRTPPPPRSIPLRAFPPPPDFQRQSPLPLPPPPTRPTPQPLNKSSG